MRVAIPLLGWSIQRTVVAAPLDGEQFTGVLRRIAPDALGATHVSDHFHGTVGDDKNLYHVREAGAVVESIRRHTAPADKLGPKPPQEGRLYVHGLRVNVDHRGQHVSVLRAWYAMPGWTITTPKGSLSFTNKFSYTGREIPFTEAAPEAVWRLLYSSGLKEKATEALGSFGKETVERTLRPSTYRSPENTGTCPACFQNVKLLKGKIMRHGWKVGGHRQRGAYGQTWHSGSCFGHNWAPFEVSSEGTQAFLKTMVLPGLAGLKKQLAFLQGQPPVLVVQARWGGKPQQFARGTPEYPRHLDAAIGETQYAIKQTEEEIRVLEERIATWKPRPLPGVKSAPYRRR